MNSNEEIIRDFIGAWSRLDIDEILSFFCEDGIYHNMPIGPVEGVENIRAFIEGFTSAWISTDWEIKSLVSAGNIVMAERLDKTLTKTGNVDLPCNGVFELEDGKIKIWRDYFDMNTYIEAVS